MTIYCSYIINVHLVFYSVYRTDSYILNHSALNKGHDAQITK